MSAKDKPEEADNGMSDEKLIACLRGIFSTPRDQIDSNTLAIVARLAADRLEALTACQQEVERLRERSEKFKWQVRDTCRRAEAAQARNADVVEGLAEALEDAADDLGHWLECSKYLVRDGYNMDGTAAVYAKALNALDRYRAAARAALGGQSNEA